MLFQNIQDNLAKKNSVTYPVLLCDEICKIQNSRSNWDKNDVTTKCEAHWWPEDTLPAQS